MPHTDNLTDEEGILLSVATEFRDRTLLEWVRASALAHGAVIDAKIGHGWIDPDILAMLDTIEPVDIEAAEDGRARRANRIAVLDGILDGMLDELGV